MLRNVFVDNLDEPDLGQTVLAMDEPSTGVSFYIKGASGLGPTDASIVTAPYADGDDNYFQSSRRGGRNVVLKLGYDPDYSANETITTMKFKLYSIFPPGERVRLWFDDDELPDMVAYGYVDKVEPNPFTADPEFQVSVIVPKADLLAPTPTSVDIRDRASYTFNYDGTAPAPVEVFCTVVEPFTQLYISDQKGEELRITTTAGFNVGDYFYMNTEKGSKTVYRSRAGTKVFLFDAMVGSADSLDLTVRPRNTQFTARTNAGATGKNVFTVRYTKRYLGV